MHDIVPFFTILVYFEIIIPFFGTAVSAVCTLSEIVCSSVIQSLPFRPPLAWPSVFLRIIEPIFSVVPV